MIDPTFSQQFGMAVQSDILRQAAKDRQRRQARSLRHENRPAWLITSARRLAGMFRASASRRGYLASGQAEATAPCNSWANLVED